MHILLFRDRLCDKIKHMVAQAALKLHGSTIDDQVAKDPSNNSLTPK
jgi:hypothetical protein